LTLGAVIGFFPANRRGDDIVLYSDDSREEILTTLHHLRQQHVKPPGQPTTALSTSSPLKALLITSEASPSSAGQESRNIWKRFAAQHDDYRTGIMLKALADRLAEAFAELMHKRVRPGILGLRRRMRNFTNEQLIARNTGAFALPPVYPACPTIPKNPYCFGY